MNSNDVTTMQEIDPFTSYGNAACRRPFVGELLRFVQGSFVYGSENLELPPGRRLAAIMPTLEIGWQRWSDNRPGERKMGRVSEAFVPPRRHELGERPFGSLMATGTRGIRGNSPTSS
jgi:hypothetical protein